MVRHENLPGRSFRPPVPFRRREHNRMPKSNDANPQPQAPSGPYGLNRSRYSNNNRRHNNQRPQYSTGNNRNQGQSSQGTGVDPSRPANDTTGDRPPKNWIVTIAEHTIHNIKTQRVLTQFHGLFGSPPPNPNTLQSSDTSALPLPQEVAEASQEHAESKSTSRADSPFSETESSSDAFQDVNGSPDNLDSDARQEGRESVPLELSSVWNSPMADDTFLEPRQMHSKTTAKRPPFFDPAIGQRHLAALPGSTITLRSLLKDVNAFPEPTYPERQSDRLWLLRNLNQKAHPLALLQNC